MKQVISMLREAWIHGPTEDAQQQFFAEINLIGDLLVVMNKARGQPRSDVVDTIISKLSAMRLRMRRQAEMPPIEDEHLKSVITTVEQMIMTDLKEAILWLAEIRDKPRIIAGLTVEYDVKSPEIHPDGWVLVGGTLLNLNKVLWLKRNNDSGEAAKYSILACVNASPTTLEMISFDSEKERDFEFRCLVDYLAYETAG